MDSSLPKGYFGIALYCPEKAVNIGTCLRSAYAFGAAFVCIIGGKYCKQGSDTCKAYDKMPVLEFQTWEKFRDAMPSNLQTVCIEITDGARSLPAFLHPERAVYVFGPEGGSIPEKALRGNQVVKIDTRVCLNLATAVTVTCYDRSTR